VHAFNRPFPTFAGFIRGTEITEVYVFSFVVERDGNGKGPSSYRCKNEISHLVFGREVSYLYFITRRVESFCFSASMPCGMRSLFLWSQRKAKKQKLCDLCGSACPMKFMSMRSEANFIGAVSDFLIYETYASSVLIE